VRFKQALAELYGLDVDTAREGACESSNAVSAHLTDDCATRERNPGRARCQIAALKPGETLLFYFAGHGSQYRDDETFDQDTGYNGTILPTDARNPDGSPGDYLRRRAEGAQGQGDCRRHLFRDNLRFVQFGHRDAGRRRGSRAASPPLAESAHRRWIGPAPDRSRRRLLGTPRRGAGRRGSAGDRRDRTRAGVFTSALIDT
jgi:hypothetical protein